ncbi:MAG: hypothetical protein ACRDGJ_02535 [Candidatus Limnocylindria bacterium]
MRRETKSGNEIAQNARSSTDMYGHHLPLVNALAAEKQRQVRGALLGHRADTRVYRLPAGRDEARQAREGRR